MVTDQSLITFISRDRNGHKNQTLNCFQETKQMENKLCEMIS